MRNSSANELLDSNSDITDHIGVRSPIDHGAVIEDIFGRRFGSLDIHDTTVRGRVSRTPEAKLRENTPASKSMFKQSPMKGTHPRNHATALGETGETQTGPTLWISDSIHTELAPSYVRRIACQRVS